MSIKLIALDLDGTLFNEQGQISEENKKIIKMTNDAGIHVVISTGRPLIGIPLTQFEGTGIQYAITTNGSGVYEIATGKCIYEDSMPTEMILPILSYLLSKDIHMDAFIEGKAFSPEQCRANAHRLDVPESLKHYILNTRVRVPDLPAFIQENHLSVQKMTLNFYPLSDGTYKDREDVKNFLLSHSEVSSVCGGYHNLEFTKAGVHKGIGLMKLAEHLHIDMKDTMAIGDTENDLQIINTAALGVAMGNATEEIKEAADYVTLSNEEDGVAAAIQHFLPELFN